MAAPCSAYTVEAHVGGKLAQIGSRLIDATARKMAEDFFSRFSAAVTGGAAAARLALGGGRGLRPSPPARRPCRQAPPAAASPRLPRRQSWVAGLVIIVAVLLYLFTRGGGALIGLTGAPGARNSPHILVPAALRTALDQRRGNGSDNA